MKNVARFIFWTFLDGFFKSWWEHYTSQNEHPHWLDWLQAKVHRQRWKADKQMGL